MILHILVSIQIAFHGFCCVVYIGRWWCDINIFAKENLRAVMNEVQLWWNSRELPHAKYMEALKDTYTRIEVMYVCMYTCLCILGHSTCEH